MGKVAPDAMIDAALAYVQACDKEFVCSAEPTSYSDAATVVDLATASMTPTTDFPVANGSSGRKCTPAAKTGVTIDHGGTATHVALGLSSGSTLRYVTTCTSQVLTGGGTVDIPAWIIQINDPS